MLDWILRCKDYEDRGQRAGLAIDRHLALLHGLQQRRLRFRGCAIDFVCQQEICENGPPHEPKFLRLQVENACPRDVCRHQIRRKLNALEVARDRARQRFHQQGFPHAGHTFDERVSASK